MPTRHAHTHRIAVLDRKIAGLRKLLPHCAEGGVLRREVQEMLSALEWQLAEARGRFAS